MKKEDKRDRRKRSIRKKIFGTSEKPRMCINKSLKNMYVQIVDDTAGRTICGLSTRSKAVSDKFKTGTRKSTSAAAILAGEIAKAAIEKGVKKVVFDRSGYRYHGVIKAFADAARKGGMDF